MKASDLEEFDRWYQQDSSNADAFREVQSLLGDNLTVTRSRLTPSMLAKEALYHKIALATLVAALIGCVAVVLNIPMPLRAD